jgi:hypothetical protein
VTMPSSTTDVRPAHDPSPAASQAPGRPDRRLVPVVAAGVGFVGCVVLVSLSATDGWLGGTVVGLGLGLLVSAGARWKADDSPRPLGRVAADRPDRDAAAPTRRDAAARTSPDTVDQTRRDAAAPTSPDTVDQTRRDTASSSRNQPVSVQRTRPHAVSTSPASRAS